MGIRRVVGRAGLVAGAVLVAGVASASPAQAECVYAQAYVTREGAPPVYVTGESDPCVAPTDWSWGLLVPGSATKEGMPSGSPNGYGFEVRVPMPV
jgi:hypothetical protein